MLKNNNCNLFIHPKDAEKIGLNGNKAKVSSRVGSVKIPYELTSDIMPGTVSIPHGWRHNGNVQLDIAASNPGESINDLTDDQFIDELTGNAALNGVEVEITSA